MQILVKKIRNALNSLMFLIFMNCHCLAKVDDKKGPDIQVGKFLSPEGTGSMCCYASVNTRCRTMPFPWN